MSDERAPFGDDDLNDGVRGGGVPGLRVGISFFYAIKRYLKLTSLCCGLIIIVMVVPDVLLSKTRTLGQHCSVDGTRGS